MSAGVVIRAARRDDVSRIWELVREFAIYYLIYSTFRTQPIVWLEDLFVKPGHRDRGVGRDLLFATARAAEWLGCWRLSWAVLDWNEPAIQFYEGQGAGRDEGGWFVYTFDQARLKAIAAERPAGGA